MTQFASGQMDVYKSFHRGAYNPQVVEVYANYINRSGKYSNVPQGIIPEGVVHVGLQYIIISHLINEWNDTFFNIDKDIAVGQHKRILSAMLGYQVDVSHLEQLHDLGYLPIEIKALPEGTLVPYQVAPYSIRSTDDRFPWLTNSLETVISCEYWPMSTSATTSVAYQVQQRQLMEKAGMDMSLLPFMIHDFSMRGMFGKAAAAMSGFGHLTSGSAGTDTIPAVMFAEQYYGANVDTELVGASVNATEHSVT
jgi:nicotinamide phosphoribosyltransferase